MKIAINARFLLPKNLEGLGSYTLEVVRRLVETHPSDEFIFLFDRPFDERFIFAKNVRPIVLFPPARHPILWWIWFEIAVKKCLVRERPDVFFSPDQFLSLRSKTPTVLTCHDLLALRFPEQIPFWARRFYAHFFPKYLRRADQIVAISEATRRDILELADVENSKITVVPNGCRSGFEPLQSIDIQQVRNEWSDGQPYFFFAGAIQPRKNLARIIDAFKRFKSLKNNKIKFLIGGRLAWQTDDVRAAYETSGFQDDIVFLGYVGEADLPKIMAAALGFVYVSIAEGFGLPLLEAMWAEVPIITSNVSSLPEVAGEAAILVNPFSTEEIANGMAQLVENEQLRADLIEKGRAQRQRFSWDDHAVAVYSLLEEASAKRK